MILMIFTITVVLVITFIIVFLSVTGWLFKTAKDSKPERLTQKNKHKKGYKGQANNTMNNSLNQTKDNLMRSQGDDTPDQNESLSDRSESVDSSEEEERQRELKE
jgi:hypothetical protein